MKAVPWYGPIYYEAYRLEERLGQREQAYEIIQKGLAELPRYGPLWLALIHVMEQKDIARESQYWLRGMLPSHQGLNQACQEALRCISKELTWR